MIAATTAMGLEPQDVCETFERSFRAANPTRDFTVPAFSLLRGAKTRRLLDDAFGDRHIEEIAHHIDIVSREIEHNPANNSDKPVVLIVADLVKT